MKRFMGMMPSSEIARQESFHTDLGPITVQAGPNGWTVLWADHSSSYLDVVATTDVNWEAALEHLKQHGFSDLKPVHRRLER